MTKIEELEKKVKGLYQSKNANRADWADWLFENHVFVVADFASSLSNKYGGNVEYSRAAALLHDIADAVTKRGDEKYDQIGLDIAHKLMGQAGYDEQEIVQITEAIKGHSCRGEERPTTTEGKILSTADALAHLKTDFYIFTSWAFRNELSLAEVKGWTLKKIDRDINNKIQFDEVRANCVDDYNLIKQIFSR